MLKTISSIVNAIGALNYKGTWNASTNTPTLASGVGTKGDYYVVSVAGSTNLDGETLWGVGDWAVFNGSIWQKVDGGSTGNFTSVNTGTLDVTGNTTLGDASTDTVRVNGYMGVGVAPNSGIGVLISNTALTGATQRGVVSNFTATSSATSVISAFQSSPGTAVASFTVTDVIGLRAANVTKGAGSTITNQHGIYIDEQNQGTNNYGITSVVTSGANKYNIYASGTAANHFAGDIRVGTTTQAGSSQLTAYGATNGQIAVQNSTNWSRLLQNANDLYIDNGTGGSAGNIVFRSGSGTTERMRLDASGNLGLGVTPSAWAVGRVLQIANVTGTFLYGAGGQSILGTNSYYDTSWKYAGTGNATYYEQTSGSHNWFTAPSGTAGNAITFTQRMALDASGNLGIGTTSAGDRVSVGGAIRVTQDGSSVGVYLAGGLRHTGSSNFYIDSNAGGAAGNIIFRNGSGFSEQMRLDSSGNVAIGTNAPANRLDIVNSASSAQMSIAGSDGQFAGMFGGTGSNGPGIFFLNTAPALRFGTATTKALGSFAELMRLTAGGNLGIGTASPNNRLTVSGEVDWTSYRKYTLGRSTAANNYLQVIWAGTKIFKGMVRIGVTYPFSVTSARSFVEFLIDADTAAGGGSVSLMRQSTNVDNTANYLAGVNYDTTTGTLSAWFNNIPLVEQDAIVEVFVTSGTLPDSTPSWSTTAPIGTAVTPQFICSTGNVGIGTTSPVNKLQVVGSFGRGAPVTKTGNFTLADTENWIICNGTGTITVTLPAASSWTGREFTIKTIAAFTVISNASNVVPLAGGAAGTAILAATAGTWATLVSDGTNWIIMQA